MRTKYFCILCFLKQLTTIPLQVRYFKLRNMGGFQYPHVVDKRHHKLTFKIVEAKNKKRLMRQSNVNQRK